MNQYYSALLNNINLGILATKINIRISLTSFVYRSYLVGLLMS